MAGAPRCCWETKSLFQSQFCQLSACVTLGQLAAYSLSFPYDPRHVKYRQPGDSGGGGGRGGLMTFLKIQKSVFSFCCR